MYTNILFQNFILQGSWVNERNCLFMIQIQLVNKGRNHTLVLWPPDVKSRLTGKDPDAGKDWGQEEKGTTEDEMVGNTNLVHMNLSKLWAIAHRVAWRAEVHGVGKSGHNLVIEQQQMTK